MAARQRFTLGRAIRVDVDFPVLEIGSPIARARSVGLTSLACRENICGEW